MNQQYLMDTDVISVAFKDYYSPDYGLEFWRWLYNANKAGTVFSIDRVYGEMHHPNTPGSLTAWSGEFHEMTLGGFFLPANDRATMEQAQLLTNWAQSKPQYRKQAKKRFNGDKHADRLLVAYAKAHGFTVVTLEKSAPESEKVIKIPDACMAFDVPFVNTFQMLTIERFKFDEHRDQHGSRY